MLTPGSKEKRQFFQKGYCWFLNRQISKFTESVQGKKSGAGWGVEITIHKAVFNPFSN